MNQLKKLLYVCSIAFIFALATIGCGGKAQIAAGVTPTPTPGTSGGTNAIPSNAQVLNDIQTMTGWENCTTCTGSALAVYNQTQGVTSPALAGSTSSQFQLLSGTLPFGGALWFKFLGAHDAATHFVYDLFFYVDNPSVAQAIEFNVSQSDGTNRYSFSTQCDLQGAHAWRAWDPIGNKWVASAVTCATPAANTWNHLVWEFERDSAGNVIFDAVSVNGNRGVVNLKISHTPDNEHGVDVAYQSDANLTGAPYSVYLDKVTLTYW